MQGVTIVWHTTAGHKSARFREWLMRGWTTRKRELEGRSRSGALETQPIRELKLGVGVRTNFAVEIDLFVLRGYPFHGGGSLEMNIDDG
jgi:hypothetical protein